MFDDLLNKAAFEAKCKEAGYDQDQTEREWEKTVNRFSAECIDECMALMPAEEQSKLAELAQMESQEGVNKFLDALGSWMDANPDVIDLRAIQEKVANKIKSEYSG